MTTVAELALRPYQKRAKHLAHEALRQGFRRVLVVAPTGSGKRIQAVDWCMGIVRQGKDGLVATDRRLLIEQMADELDRHGVPYGVIMDGYEENRAARIQLATIQSLESRYLKRDPSELPPADVVLLDEAHKAVAQYMALLSRYPAAYAFLLTATPVGAAGKTLIQDGYADVLTEGVRNSELIRAGYLLPTTVIAPSEPNIQGVKILRREEFAEGQLSRRVAEVTCFADLFAEWAPFADRQTIVFAPGIAYCNGLCYGPGDSFKARGIPAEVINSQVKPRDRERIIHQFREGKLRVLVSVDVLREGFDVPAASCAIDLQPNAQFRGYWQKIGRVKRPHEDQREAVYIDMSGNAWRFQLHPDDDPDWSEIVGDKTTQQVLYNRKPGEGLARCPRCAAVYKARPKCPECGYEPQPQEIVRKIRMGNGKLKVISAFEKRRKEKTLDERKRDQWKSCLFIGLKTGKTMKQAAWICSKRFEFWPHAGYPCVPEHGSARWNLRVDQCLDAQKIMREFGR